MMTARNVLISVFKPLACSIVRIIGRVIAVISVCPSGKPDAVFCSAEDFKRPFCAWNYLYAFCRCRPIANVNYLRNDCHSSFLFKKEILA